MPTHPLPLDDKPVYICTIPAGASIAEIETGDPLRKKYVIAHADHNPKTIEIGPEGVTVTEITCAPDMVIEIGTP